MENVVTQKNEYIETAPTTPKSDGAPAESKSFEIGTVESLLGLAVLVFGIGAGWMKLNSSLNQVIKKLDDEIAPDLKNVRERFLVVEDHVETLWKDKIAPAHSPRQLNESGQKILEESGIKKIVDAKMETLLKVVKDKKIDNAYDAEREIERVMMELPEHCPDIVKELKEGAFRVGHDIPVVLFVGSIYLRNQIFPDLGFSLNDLDKPKS